MNPDEPKSGLYLDAALAVVQQEVEERIDQLTTRRRFRVRLGVAALALLTVASGSLTAAATVGGWGEVSATSTAMAVETELSCISGPDAEAPAYFSARYSAPDTGDAQVDRFLLCLGVQAALAEDDREWAAASPDELRRLAAGLIAAATVTTAKDGTDARGPVTVRHVTVADSQWKRTVAAQSHAVCEAEEGDRAVVLSATRAEHPAGSSWWAVQCAQQGYRLVAVR